MHEMPASTGKLAMWEQMLKCEVCVHLEGCCVTLAGEEEVSICGDHQYGARLLGRNLQD